MAELSQVFLYLLTQTKIYHWQTTNYNKHKASGKYYEAVDPLVDQFIETYQGRYGQIQYDRFNVSFGNLTDRQYMKVLEEFAVFLSKDVPRLVGQSDSDLLNLRDEMLGQTNHAMYLLRLQ